MRKTSYNILKCFVFLLLVGLFVFPDVSHAKGLGKPKLDPLCAYQNDHVYMKWSKVSGAKKYEIQRAKINTKKDNSIGKWKKWTTTKKTVLNKKTTGDYKYRVRAINGGKKGKWSAAKRLFAASSVITTKIYDPPSYLWGMKLNGQLTFRVLVNNKTQSQMGFVATSSQSTIYALDGNGNVINTWPGYLYIAEAYGYAKQINPYKENSVYFYCNMDEEEYNQYKDCKFMITASFYPNPYTESITRQMAIACTDNIKECAIAGK